jgi:hypothetical protein
MTERFTVENRPTREQLENDDLESPPPVLWGVEDHEKGQFAGFGSVSWPEVMEICEKMRADPSYADKFFWRKV